MKNYSDSPLHQQIYQTMQLKSTTELLAIWEANDRTAWSDETFDVIYNLLTKRLDQVPVQKDTVYESEEESGEAAD